MLYFAYGSNLCAEDLAAWCRARGRGRAELAPLGPAFLPDRRLAFTHFSTARRGGVLDVPEAKGHAVEGRLFRLGSDATLAALDRKEGDGHTYRRVDVVALTEDGRETPAFTYEVVPELRQPFVAPADGYLDVVQRGYEAHGLAEAPLAAAARAESHAGRVVGLFVYGTLRRGEERHHLLARHNAVDRGEATTVGTLLDLGSFPGLVVEPGGASVLGEVYDAPDPAALFEELDAVEGFRGFGASGSLYRRALVAIRRAGWPASPAWTYVYAGASDGRPVIGSGDWRQSRRP